MCVISGPMESNSSPDSRERRVLGVIIWTGSGNNNNDASLQTLVLSCMIAAGVQFGESLSIFSPLTLYFQVTLAYVSR